MHLPTVEVVDAGEELHGVVLELVERSIELFVGVVGGGDALGLGVEGFDTARYSRVEVGVEVLCRRDVQDGVLVFVLRLDTLAVGMCKLRNKGSS